MISKNEIEQLNNIIEESDLPNPILTEHLLYHERPDWKKQREEAVRAYLWINELLVDRKYDRVKDIIWDGLISDVGFQIIKCEGNVSLIGKRSSPKRNRKATHFVYNHESVEIHFGFDWKLNCEIPCFQPGLDRKIVKRCKLLGPDGKRASGKVVETDDDLQQWLEENVPFRTPDFTIDDLVDGLEKGKWPRYVWRVRQVCKDLAQSVADKRCMKNLRDEVCRYLMKESFTIHQKMFPINEYSKDFHKAMRIVIRAMELVKGVKFNGGIMFIEDNDK